MTPQQCRQARELLGWTRDDLGFRANCSQGTVRHFEISQHQLSARSRRVIVRTFQAAGIEFIDAKSDSAGVSLRREGA